MKKSFLLSSFLTVFAAAAYDFPNSSFEHDVLAVWNRMPDQQVMNTMPRTYSYSSDCVSGKRSLRLRGEKFQNSFEAVTYCEKGKAVFALKMKAPQGAKVKVKLTLYSLTDKKEHFEKTFAVTDKFQEFKLPIRLGRGGLIGPANLVIDPGKSEILVDDCGFLPAVFRPIDGGVMAKNMRIPAYIPLKNADFYAEGKGIGSTWEFNVFPGSGGEEKNVPLTGVMLFPKSKVFFNSGNFELYDGNKKLDAAFTPVAAWPKDKSLSSLRVDFVCDTGKTVKPLHLKFIPGKKKTEKSVVPSGKVFARNGVIIRLDNDYLWEKNGTLGKGSLYGVDYAGRTYTFKLLSNIFEIANRQNITLLRRGKMLSQDGKRSIGWADIRLIFRGSRPGVELDAALANTSDRPVLIKELYWESAVSGKKTAVKMTVSGNKKKQRFTFDTFRKGKLKRQHIKSAAPQLPPPLTLQEKKGMTFHCFDGARYYPSELEITETAVRGALWPASAKVLTLAPGLTLRKKFLISQAAFKGNLDHPAAVMASGKSFAASGALINMAALDTQKFPYFENRLKRGLGKLAPQEVHRRFDYGQFDYGDHPGDGGWANLESFEDYVLFHRALRSGDPELFRLALTANNHYIYVDTDIRSGLPHVHCVNHVIGGRPFGHAWVPGVLTAYLVTGNPANYQIARRMLDACLKLSVKDGAIQQGRNFGFYELTLAEGYAIFNDKDIADRFMKQLRYQVDRYAGSQATPAERRMQRTSIPRQNSLFFVNGSGLVPFHCWYGLTAFLKMYELTEDPYILPVLEKEFKNIINLEMTYRPQLETHWPGLPAEKMFPAIATDYLLGRGAFYYPVLAKYAQLSGKTQYRDLAIDTLYAGLLAARDTGNLQDVFMASPLVHLPADFNEKKQVEKIRKLLWNGAAPKLLNGDFSQSLLYKDLVIPKKGIGKPVYPVWALAKPYPRYWHFTESKQIISSQFMSYRGYYYTLDDKEFGKEPPALRLDPVNKTYFNGTSLTSAKFQLPPGEYEYSLSIKKPAGTELRRLGMRVIPFGKEASRIGVVIDKNNRMIQDTSADLSPKIYHTSYKDLAKTGWKRLTFRFRIKEHSLGIFRLTYNLLPKVERAHIYLDDLDIRRIGD